MSRPCSQLNSKVIRDQAECHIIAEIEKTCSVVAFKCVWRVKDDEIQRSWNWICEKRDECDLTLSKLSEVCFFFSAISASKLGRKKKKNKASDEAGESGDDSNEESAINPSQISSPGKQILPAISYWVACQTHNGSAVNPFKIQRALGKCGLEFYLSRASRKKSSHHLNQLCQVLKDHKNPCLMNFVEASYQHCLRALQDEIEVSDDEQQSQEISATENVVRLRVLNDDFKPMMTASIQELRRAGLKIDCFGLRNNAQETASTTPSFMPHKPLSCPITVLCHDIDAAMKKLQFSVYRGDVYKKVAESQFTFKFLCSMKTFLLNLMGNECFKDRLVQHFQRVLPLLSEPESCLISQLKIDRDLVEVQDGWLWSFSAGSFAQGIIPECQRGLTSPRAYVHYNSAADPDPKYFEQILKNSLPEEQIKQFCADFLALFRQKEHKRPVPCAIGAADSGKTSLFSPVFQIVPLSRIARVTKQKSFNKSMIDSQTEVIFLDEAHRDLLDVDDWKIICQGGFTSHDVKWKKAEGFHCRASMYITCQKEIDFGDAHNDAMNRRLHKYHFKSLPHVEPEANKWLREHAMDCIVWAQRLTVADSSGTLTTHISEGDGLAGEDVERILSVSITEEHLPSSSQPDCTEEESETDHVSPQNEGSTTDDSSDEGDLMKLRREIETAEPDGIRQRQLSMLLKNAEARQKAQKRFQKTRRDHRLAGRRRLLVNLGVVGESQADRLITDPDCPLPPTLEQKHQQAIKDRNERLEAQKQREDREKVRRAFSNPWLENMEKEMAECNWRFERTKDAEMRAVLKSLMEIDSDKLRAFHQGQGSLGLQLAVEERKKLCLQHGWVEPACANLVRDVYSPLPMIVDLSNFNDCNSDRPVLAPPDTKDDTDDDDDALFITPKTPSYVPSNDVPQPMLSPPTSQESVEYDDREMVLTPKTPSYVPSTDGSSASVCPSPLLRLPSPCRPSKRRRLSRSQLPKGQKRVTSFFCSQQRPKE